MAGKMPKKNKKIVTSKESLDNIRDYMMEGYRDVDLAKDLGISLPTLKNYKRQYPDFAKAIADGKQLPDDKIEAAVFNAAYGFIKVTCDYEPDENGELKLKHKRVETLPPSERLAVFWLKNRRPDRWRDRLEHSNEIMAVRRVVVDTTGHRTKRGIKEELKALEEPERWSQLDVIEDEEMVDPDEKTFGYRGDA